LPGISNIIQGTAEAGGIALTAIAIRHAATTPGAVGGVATQCLTYPLKSSIFRGYFYNGRALLSPLIPLGLIIIAQTDCFWKEMQCLQNQGYFGGYCNGK